MPPKRRFIAALAFVLLVAGSALALGWFHFWQPNGGISGHRWPILAWRIGDAARDFTVGGPAHSPKEESRDIATLDYSLEKVRDEYYHPVKDAELIAGERKGLVALLKAKHVVAQLPAPQVSSNDPSADEAAANGILSAAFEKYGARFGDEILTEAAIAGMLNALSDPYTVFLSARQMRQLNEIIRGGDFGGIGIYIGKDPKTHEIFVIQPIESTPADRAGLKPGDVIEAVDGHATKGLDLDPVEAMIRGRPGSIVKLLIKRSGSGLKSFAIVREKITVPSVTSRMIGNDIGYVQLIDFGDRTPREASDALRNLLNKGAKALILDLRNNGGGKLEAAVDVSSKFVADGPIVSVINRQGRVETHDANQDAIPPRPLVVLVNKYSASASEITAGAIQDTRVGVLLGTQTFGKGVVQTIYDLPNESALKITTARYVTPNGRDVDRRGIRPDILVPMDPKLVGVPNRDAQLKTALTYLRRQLALNPP